MIVKDFKMDISFMPPEIIENILWFLSNRDLLSAIDASTIFLPAPKDWRTRLWISSDILDLCKEDYLNGLKIVLFKQSLNDDKNISDAVIHASAVGNLDIVKLLHLNGAKCPVLALNNASAKGHLNVVKYLHSIGIIGELTLEWAYLNGNIEIIQFLESNGYTNS